MTTLLYNSKDTSNHSIDSFVFIIIFYSLLLIGFYPFYAGFLSDEMVTYNLWKGFDSYLSFQKYYSDSIHMVARPIFGILRGASIWLFGNNPIYYHLLNITILIVGFVLFYLLLKRLYNNIFAFVSTIFAISYPFASAVFFSAIIINANFAFLLFLVALHIELKSKKSFNILVCFIYVLSLLSYEAFYCYITFLFLVKLHKNNNIINKNLIKNYLLYLFVIFASVFFYRKFLQFLIFSNKTDKLRLLSIKTMLVRTFESAYYNITSHTIDFYLLIKNSFLKGDYLIFLLNLFLTSLLYIIIKNTYKSNKKTISNKNLFYLFIVVFISFILYQLVFINSWIYFPNIHGYESRILAPYRYLYGLIIAIILFKYLGYRYNKILILFSIFLLSVNTFCNIMQKNAWLGAYRYSINNLNKIIHSIEHSQINIKDSISIIAYIPYTYPEQVNQEQIILYEWDASPLIREKFNNNKLRVQIINNNIEYTKEGIKSKEKLINEDFPFYLFNNKDSTMQYITNQESFKAIINK